eukprot:jgi/Botrbrau1/6383/Bobra.49_1s0001.1
MADAQRSETSAQTIIWTLALIAQHPDVDAKIAKELDSAGLLVTEKRPKPNTLTFDHLSKLPYLNMAIKEAMRLLPVVSDGTLRMSKQDVVLGGKYTIPAGTTIMVPFYSIFRDPNVWKDPDLYIPVSFLPKMALPSCKYILRVHNIPSTGFSNSAQTFDWKDKTYFTVNC